MSSNCFHKNHFSQNRQNTKDVHTLAQLISAYSLVDTDKAKSYPFILLNTIYGHLNNLFYVLFCLLTGTYLDSQITFVLWKISNIFWFLSSSMWGFVIFLCEKLMFLCLEVREKTKKIKKTFSSFSMSLVFCWKNSLLILQMIHTLLK